MSKPSLTLFFIGIDAKVATTSVDACRPSLVMSNECTRQSVPFVLESLRMLAKRRPSCHSKNEQK